MLKVFLDLLPQTALKEKKVLPLATGGSTNYMLALNYAQRQVLQSIGASHILPGIHATDLQVVVLPEGGYQIPCRFVEVTGFHKYESFRRTWPMAQRCRSLHFTTARPM